MKKLLRQYETMPIAVKASIWFVFCSLLQKCVALITTPIFTRIIPTEQYGQFTIYNSWLQILTILTTWRLNFAVFNKGMSKYKEDRDGYTVTMQSITTSLTAGLMIIYLLFRKQINNLTELPTFVMLGIFLELFFISALDFWTIRKRYEYIYKPIVIRTLLMTLLNALVGVVSVMLSQEKGYARILSCIFVNCIFGIPIYIYNIKKGKRLFKAEYARFAILFNLPLLLHYLSQYILDQFGHIMVQKMVGFSAAALYGVAYNVGLIIKVLTESVNQAMVPWLYGKLEKKEMKNVDNTLFAIFVLIGVFTVAFSVCAPELMMLFADSQYYEARYVVPPVTLGVFFMFLYTAFANIEFFFDANKFTMYISMGGAVLNIVLNYICIKRFGYVAAAYTSAVCYLVYAVSHYIYMTLVVKKKLGISQVLQTPRLIALVLSVVLATIGIIMVYNNTLLRYGAFAVILLVLFLKRKKLIEVYSTLKTNDSK